MHHHGHKPTVQVNDNNTWRTTPYDITSIGAALLALLLVYVILCLHSLTGGYVIMMIEALIINFLTPTRSGLLHSHTPLWVAVCIMVVQWMI